MPTAIVLAGGGARCAFEVGALRCLYDRGIRPDIICGVSGGGINAAKLAEGEDPADPRRGLAGLETLWRSLQANGDMFAEADWLRDPRMDPRVRDVLTGRHFELGSGTMPGPEWGDLAPIVANIGWIMFLMTDGNALLQSAMVILELARSVFLLNPLQAKLAAELDPAKVAAWAGQGRLRLGIVGLESGQLRWVTETGRVLERDGRPVPDLTRIPAACQPQANAVQAAQIELDSAREQLRQAVTGKEAFVPMIRAAQRALALAKAQLEQCLKANPPDPAQTDVRTGVLASASIPGIFPPVSIAGETYVDGGVRENMPLQVAADLGADTIYAVSPGPPDLKPSQRSFARAGIMDIVARSLTEIVLNEVGRDDARITPRPGQAAPVVFLVQPDIELHGITVIDPGLIQINRDYGYMRAADVLDRVSPATRRWSLATLIASQRMANWALENRRWGHEDPTRPGEPAPQPDPGLQGAIDQGKTTLQDLVDERRRLAGPMPADIDTWSRTLERHPWSVSFNHARYVRQTPPAGQLPARSVVAVSVTMSNTGTTTWQTSARYALGSQSPQDNANWGLSRVALPGPVPPGQTATFNFQVTLPLPPSAVFQWRMVQDGVGWFGDATPPVTVPITEPADCAGIRSGITDRQRQINDLEQAKVGLDPRDPADLAEIRQINLQIDQLRAQITQLRNQGQQLGCAPLP